MNENLVRRKPSILVPYIQRYGKAHNTVSVYKMLYSCLSKIYRISVLSPFRRFMYVVSVCSQPYYSFYGSVYPHSSVVYLTSSLSVTLSLQINSKFSRILSPFRITKTQYLTEYSYLWEVEFVSQGETLTEKYLTLNFTKTDIDKWKLEFDFSNESLRFLYCCLNVVVYSLMSHHVPSVLSTRQNLLTDYFINDRNGVDSTDIRYIYFILKPKSVFKAVQIESYHLWVYCEDILNRFPFLLFDFLVTPKVLMNLMIFYSDGFSLSCIKYLSNNKQVVDNFRSSFLQLSRQLVNKNSVINSANTRKSSVFIPEQLLNNLHLKTYELVDMQENRKVINHQEIKYTMEDTVGDIYKAFLVVSLYVRFDVSFARWLSNENEVNQVTDKIAYLYRQFVYYKVFENKFDLFLSQASRLSSETLFDILLTRSLSVYNPEGEPLMPWKSLLVLS